MRLCKAYKFRLKTNMEIEELCFQFAGCNRFVWNKALALQKDSLDKTQKLPWYNDLAGCLVDWKRTEELSFLKTAPSQTLQQTLKFLDRAWKDAFDPKQPDKKFPVFKKKFKCSDSFRYPQGFKLEGNRVFLPKIGWVGFFKSQEILGTPKNMTVSRGGEHWFVSIQTEQDVLVQQRTVVDPYQDVVGMDMGVARFLTDSQGGYVEPLNSFKKLEEKLARAQRLLSRKKKFSKNWKKQKQVVSKLHSNIADARADFLQKQSTTMSKNHAVIVAEDLKIRNMSASAKGDRENPGKNVKAKSGLNKSILDQGWGDFLRMVGYKQQWSGGKLIKVDPRNTSRTCPECGYVSAENRKTQATFKCQNCAYMANADFVGAMNIRARGLQQLGGGAHRDSLWRENTSSPMKQEPAGPGDRDLYPKGHTSLTPA